MEHSTYLKVACSLDGSVSRKHKFFVESLNGEEGICAGFTYRIRTWTAERLTDAEMKELLGKRLTIEIHYTRREGHPGVRFINGIVFHLIETGFSKTSYVNALWSYQIEISSWLKKLDYIADCRIFQMNGASNMDIVRRLFDEYRLHDYRDETGDGLPRKDYSTIYNETVGSFIRRLLQEEGILWYFEHNEKNHIMVLSLDSATLPAIESASWGRHEGVRHFSREVSFNPVSKIERAAYDWEKQSVQIVSGNSGFSKGRLHDFQYSNNFSGRIEGEKSLERAVRGIQGKALLFHGSSSIRALQSGYRFKLQAPVLPDLNENTFLVRSLKTSATSKDYRNEFVALPAHQPFVLPESDPVEKPRMVGPQTATVAGEGNPASVQTDSLGRIKVRFHWDHHSPPNASRTSAYLRVMMPSAGTQRGMLFNPRIGEEVVVDFEDGDPDRPFIAGSVYSRHNPPAVNPAVYPYRSIIKNSAEPDANRILFDDKPNAENLEIVARKEMNISVGDGMKVDVKKNISIDATSSFLVALDGVDIRAGNEINNMSLATILDIAAGSISETAGLNILNAAAGMVMQASGDALSNMAGTMIANTSVLGIKQLAQTEVTSEAETLILNTASKIINAGEAGVENRSKLAILNSTATDTVSKGTARLSKIKLLSSTEAKKSVVSGKTNAGPA